jgi:hypothetical protein
MASEPSSLQKMQTDYLATFNQTQAEKDSSQALADIAAKQALVSSSEEMGMNKIQNTPIEMGLIQGEQAAVQRSALAQQNALKAQAVPLTERLAQAQAARTLSQQQLEKQIGSNTPTTTEVGKSLVQFDPVTGTYKQVYSEPAATTVADPFTLSQGQTRFDANGKLIASGLPPTDASGKALTPNQQANLELAISQRYMKYTDDARVSNGMAQRAATTFNQAISELNAGKGVSPQVQAQVIAFNKMLDPGSVVREGEYARTYEGQSLLDRIQGTLQNITSGTGKITVETLVGIQNAINAFQKQNNAYIAKQEEFAKKQAEAWGLNPSLVIPGGTNVMPEELGAVNRVTPNTTGMVTPENDPYNW